MLNLLKKIFTYKMSRVEFVSTVLCLMFMLFYTAFLLWSSTRALYTNNLAPEHFNLEACYYSGIGMVIMLIYLLYSTWARLINTNLPKLSYIINFIPYVGFVYLFALFLMPSKEPKANNYSFIYKLIIIMIISCVLNNTAYHNFGAGMAMPRAIIGIATYVLIISICIIIDKIIQDIISNNRQNN